MINDHQPADASHAATPSPPHAGAAVPIGDDVVGDHEPGGTALPQEGKLARGPLTFRQRDVVAVAKAAQAAGLSVYRIEIDKAGRIVLVTSAAEAERQRQEASGKGWEDV